MLRLPLYRGTEDELQPIERASPLAPDPACRRCPLARSSPAPCLPPRGIKGTDPDNSNVLLAILSPPGRDEELAVGSARGHAASWVLSELRRGWSGPIVLVHALRCRTGAEATDQELEACRPYAVHDLIRHRPARVVTFGSEAQRLVTGRAHPLDAIQGAYCWVKFSGVDIPVFLLEDPSSQRGNRFIERRQRQAVDFALSRPLASAPPAPQGVVRVVRTVADAHEAVAAIRRAVVDSLDGFIAIDIESYGELYTPEFEILAVAVAVAGEDDAWIWDRRSCNDEAIRQPLVELLEDERVRKCLQNGKSDATALLYRWACRLAGYAIDTRLFLKLLNPEAIARLKVLSEIVGMGGYKEAFDLLLGPATDQLKNSTKEVKRGQQRLVRDPETDRIDHAARRIALKIEARKFSYAFVSEMALLIYCAKDAISTARLGVLYDWQLDEVEVDSLLVPGTTIKPLRRTWDLVVGPSNEAMIDMEAWGAPVSRRALEILERSLERKLADLGRQFDMYRIDPSKDVQVRDLLFKQLRLPILHKTETGLPSVDKDALKALRDEHEVVELLIKFSALDKLKNTYAKGLLHHLRPDGRIHCTIQPDGTRAGRISVKEPNLNNIPTGRGEDDDGAGKMIKQAFVAQDGWSIMEIDQSQLELRRAAALSGDPTMRALYESGVDFHLETARRIAKMAWNIPVEKVTELHRDYAKRANFLIVYGGGKYTLAEKLGISADEAGRILDAIKALFPVFFAWCRQQVRLAERTGYVWVMWQGELAYRRPLFDIGIPDARAQSDDEAAGRRNTAKNGAGNTPVQGESAFFQTAALRQIIRWIRDNDIPARLMLTIYDSLVFEVRNDWVERVACYARDVMTSWDNNGVPLEAEAKAGPTWGDMVKLKLPERITA